MAPFPIEGLFGDNLYVEQICVMGSSRKQPIAVVVLSEDGQRESRQIVEASLAEAIKEVNKQLESHEHLDGILVTDEPWTIDNELLTPTMKIKRHVIEDRFKFIEQLNFDKPVLFEDQLDVDKDEQGVA